MFVKYFNYHSLKFVSGMVLVFILSGCGGGTSETASTTNAKPNSLPDVTAASITPSIPEGSSTDVAVNTNIRLIIPGDRSTGVAVNTNIILRSNTELDSATLASNIYLIGLSGNTVLASISYANQNITLTPDSPLEPTTAYNIVCESGIVDIQGNSIPSNAWTFSTGSGGSLPLLGQWESNMITVGEKWGRYIRDNNVLNSTFYDAERVFYAIADYTGQREPWRTYSQEAERVFRDNYAVANNYRIQPWWRFPQGLYVDYIKTGDITSQAGLDLMRNNGPFANVKTSSYVANWYRETYSREIAYLINSHIYAEKAGYARDAVALNAYLAMALNHINEWVTGNYSDPNTGNRRVAPFMFGLTAEALINYYEWEVAQGRNPDQTIPNEIKRMADYLWTTATVSSGPNAGKKMWVPNMGGRAGNWNDTGGTGFGAFRYEDKNNGAPAPDLSLLIAPVYAWLFNHFADQTYIERGDLIWAGGVAHASINFSGKIYNQNYHWSFEYVKWRQKGYSKIN